MSNISAKEILIKALRNSSAHGIPRVLNSEKFILKLLWFVFTVSSIGLCSFLIIKNFMNYFMYETSTKSRIMYDFNASFPSITFCSFDIFSSEYGKIFVINTDLNRNNESIDGFDFIQSTALLNANNKTEFLKYGNDLSKLIIFYEYASEIKGINEDFSYVFTPFFGNCYTFNPSYYENESKRDPHIETISGYSGGIYAELNLSSALNSKGVSDGVIFVHEFGSSPLSVSPIFIKTQYLTFVSIKRTKSIMLPKPYSLCDSNTNDRNAYDSDLFKGVHNTKFKYKQVSCIQLCYHRLMLQHCSCYYYLLTIFTEGKPCLTKTELNCIFNLYFNFGKLDYLNQLCLPKCPLECESFSYTQTISAAELSDSPKEIATIKIYFDDYSVTQMTESALIDVVTLLSNIGGIGGLCMGLSCLSLAEIFDTFIQIAFILMPQKNQVTQVKKILH